MAQLHEETEKGNFQWFMGDHRAYFCNHKKFTLSIDRFYDPDREVDSFHFSLTKGIKNSPFSVYDTESDYRFMKNFYEAVIANANGVSTDIEGFFD